MRIGQMSAPPQPSTRRLRIPVLLLTLIAAGSQPLRAQSPAERAEIGALPRLARFDRRFDRVLALEKRLIEEAKADRNNALTHLKLGFLSLRLGNLGGQSHYEDAASEFQWAIDLQPNWPYSHYGMGFAEYGIGDSQISFVTGIKTMLGKDALTRSAVAFARSAEVDPSFDHGLVDLAGTALEAAGEHQAGRCPAGPAASGCDRGGHASAGSARPRQGGARGG